MRLYDRLSKKEADDFALVLLSAGVHGFKTVRSDTGWEMHVADDQGMQAFRIIEQFRAENRADPARERDVGPRFHWRWSGVWGALLIACVHLAVYRGGDARAFYRVYAASADRILSGEWHRAATALLLHADIGHLAANVAGLLIFASAVCSVAGLGVGWLLVLLSGIAGNMGTAFLYQTDHVAVGASTAVFGAIGLLSTYQFTRRIRDRGHRLAAFLPFGAGLALLGFLGAAAHTDVVAHLFGFTAGIALGFGLPPAAQKADSRWHQSAALLLTTAVLALAWLAGIA